MLLLFTLFDVQYAIMNTYGPVTPQEKPTFWQYVKTIDTPGRRKILIGDLNCYTRPALDRWPEPLTKYTGLEEMKEAMSALDLIDTLPDTTSYFESMTRMSIQNGILISATRIDSIWADPDTASLTRNHRTTPLTWTDHRQVGITIEMGTPVARHKWKKILPMDASSQPVRDHLAAELDRLNHSPEEADILRKWVEIKRRIVGKNSAGAAARWRAEKSAARRAQARLTHLEKQCPRSGYSPQWAMQWSLERDSVIKFATKEASLASLMAAAQRAQEDERPTRYFLDKFKARQKSVAMDKVKDAEGNTYTTPEEVARVCHTFYTNLYASEVPVLHSTKQPEFFNTPRNHPRPPELMYPATLKELHGIIKSLPSRKSPGPDGIPYEFYKLNWAMIAPTLLTLINKCISECKLIPDGGASYLITLFKKGDPLELKNWRPIALSNTDTKILTKLMALRLGTVAKSTISENQFGFVPARSIWDNVHSVANAARDPMAKGILCFLDQEKAYDRVDWNYSIAAMKLAQLDEKFIMWAAKFTSSATMKIVGPGFVTEDVRPGRGFKQGDPLSPLLYNFSLDPLLRALDGKLKGIKVWGQPPLKCMAFADDCVVAATGPRDVKHIEKLFKQYEEASQAKLNVAKSQIIPLRGKTFIAPWNVPNTTEPVRHLGVLLTNTGTANSHMEESLIDAARKKVRGLDLAHVGTMGRVQLINTFVVSKITYLAHVVPFTGKFISTMEAWIQKWIWGDFPPVTIDKLYLKKKNGGMALLQIREIINRTFSKFLIPMLQQPAEDQEHWAKAARTILARRLKIRSPKRPEKLNAYLCRTATAIGPRDLDNHWKETLAMMRRNEWKVSPNNAGAVTITCRGKEINLKDLPSIIQEPIEAELFASLPDSEKLDGSTTWRLCFDNLLPAQVQTNNWKIVRMVYRTAERANPERRSCIHCGQYDDALHRYFRCTIALSTWLTMARLTGLSPISTGRLGSRVNWFFQLESSTIHRDAQAILFSLALHVIHLAFVTTLNGGQTDTSATTARLLSSIVETFRNILFGSEEGSPLWTRMSRWGELHFLELDEDNRSCKTRPLEPPEPYHQCLVWIPPHPPPEGNNTNFP